MSHKTPESSARPPPSPPSPPPPPRPLPAERGGNRIVWKIPLMESKKERKKEGAGGEVGGGEESPN